MSPTAELARSPERHPGIVLAAGLLLACMAALAPAGLGGQPVPAASVAVWLVVFGGAIAAQRAHGAALRDALRRLLPFLPFILLLAVPAAIVAPPGRRLATGLGLAARATAATSAGIALAAWLGPAGLVAGMRQLRVPERLVQILAEALASLAIVLRHVRAMLRAREARRPGFGAWSSLAAAPVRTVRGFGRLVAALLLRSLERAESLDRARRARGAGAA
jgi:energy-coupling factor transporter transmembrane protein EcfT